MARSHDKLFAGRQLAFASAHVATGRSGRAVAIWLPQDVDDIHAHMLLGIIPAILALMLVVELVTIAL